MMAAAAPRLWPLLRALRAQVRREGGDVSGLKAEQRRRSGSVPVNCSRLHSGVQLWEPVSLGRPVLKGQAQQQAGQETSQKTWEVMHLQVKGDLEEKELQDRGTELSALLEQSQKQNEEKEETVKTLNDTVEILEASLLEKEYEASLTESVKEENLSFQKLIKDITGALKEELSARQDSLSLLLHQHRQQEEKCRKLQQSLEQLEQECQTASSHSSTCSLW
ncbi:unnamed protein product [Bubo scandiacus]